MQVFCSAQNPHLESSYNCSHTEIQVWHPCPSSQLLVAFGRAAILFRAVPRIKRSPSCGILLGESVKEAINLNCSITALLAGWCFRLPSKETPVADTSAAMILFLLFLSGCASCSQGMGYFIFYLQHPTQALWRGMDQEISVPVLTLNPQWVLNLWDTSHGYFSSQGTPKYVTLKSLMASDPTEFPRWQGVSAPREMMLMLIRRVLLTFKSLPWLAFSRASV